MISVYSKKTDIELSQRRLEIMDQYNKIIQYGRCNPVWFIENIFKVQLLDYQKWVIMSSWTTEKAVWVCSRNTGKTFMGSLYVMAKNLLFPSFETWLMSLTAAQSQGLFMKMENIAKKNIASLTGSSTVFWDELVKSQSNSNGFIHDKQSYRCQLFNGSQITSLVGTPETVVGKRSNLNVYDEASKISHDFFALTEPFTTQDSNFKTGSGIDLSVLPKVVPTQCLYMSSAEDTSSYLYEIYKTGARAMAIGRKDYFVADINCEVPLHPTKNGKMYAPLFKQSEVDSAMRNNEYRALREYYNIFDTTGGVDTIISRDTILKNERDFLPVFSGENKEGHIYGIFYDPARVSDNSIILVAEYWKDKEVGWKCRFINCINLIEDKGNGEKKLLNSVEQLDKLRDLLVKYSGSNTDYKNMHVFIDPGAGGGGRILADQLMFEFYDYNYHKRFGIIDKNDEIQASEQHKFPTAISGVLQLLTAVKYKNEMFDAFSDLTKRDLIEFMAPTPRNGELEIDGQTYHLTREELKVFLEMDLMKEEALMMKKTKTDAGNIKYTLPPDKIRNTHDDRIFVAAAAAHYLQQLRNKDQFDISVPKGDMSALLGHIGKRSNGGFANTNNPFSGRNNPFKR